MWYVHFPPQGRCTPASSSLGIVFPRSPPPRTKMLHCCRNNAQLQHSNPFYSNFIRILCNRAFLVFPERGGKKQRKKNTNLCSLTHSHAGLLPDICYSFERSHATGKRFVHLYLAGGQMCRVACWGHLGSFEKPFKHSPTGLQVHSPLPFPRQEHSSM